MRSCRLASIFGLQRVKLRQELVHGRPKMHWLLSEIFGCCDDRTFCPTCFLPKSTETVFPFMESFFEHELRLCFGQLNLRCLDLFAFLFGSLPGFFDESFGRGDTLFHGSVLGLNTSPFQSVEESGATRV